MATTTNALRPCARCGDNETAWLLTDPDTGLPVCPGCYAEAAPPGAVNNCGGCATQPVAGVISHAPGATPATRCDECQRYPDDATAQQVLDTLGQRAVGWLP